jgi:large subunit ribosomal protein L22
MKALLKNFHQSPRKVRLVANAIRGQKANQARTTLQLLPQKSTGAILKLLDSAIANARQVGASPDDLIVKTITVNKGMALKRFAPRARGRAARFERTMSIVAIELGTTASMPKKAKKVAKTEDAAVVAAPKKAAKKAAKKAKAE